MRSHAQLEWIARLEPEIDNLRAALRWAVDNDSEAGLRIVAGLVYFWDMRGFCVEILAYTDELLSAAGNPTPLVAYTYNIAAYLGTLAYDLTLSQVYLAQMQTHLEKAFQISTRVGYPEGLTLANVSYSMICLYRGEFETGLALAGKALEIAQATGAEWLSARCFMVSGFHQMMKGNYAEARQAYEAALNLSRKNGDVNVTSYMLNCLGNLDASYGFYDAARPAYQEGLELSRQTKNKITLARNLQALGELNSNAKNYAQASVFLKEAIAIQTETGDRELAFTTCRLGSALLGLGKITEAQEALVAGFRLAAQKQLQDVQVLSLIGLAEIMALQNQPAKAVQILRAIQATPEQGNNVMRWIGLSRPAELAQAAKNIRDLVGESVFEAEYAPISLDEAFGYVSASTTKA